MSSDHQDPDDRAKLETRLREIAETRRHVKVRVGRRGERVGDVKLIEPVGEGRTSEVWLAWREASREHVAVKIIRAGLDADDVLAGLEALRARLDGRDLPGLVPLRAVGTTGAGHPCLVRDYVPGQPFPGDGDPQALGDELSAAVAAWHAAGLTHGALAAANILVVRDGDARRLRLVDPDPDGGTVADDLAAVARLRETARPPTIAARRRARRLWHWLVPVGAAALAALAAVLRYC